MTAADARDLAACRALLANGSRTFLAASRLLPAAVRDPACALYAFCRLADDEVDGQTGGGAPHAAGDAAGQAASAAAVLRLRARLARIYDGAPAPEAADRALAVVVRRFAIPPELRDGGASMTPKSSRSSITSSSFCMRSASSPLRATGFSARIVTVAISGLRPAASSACFTAS